MTETKTMFRFCLSFFAFVSAIYLLSASGRIGLSDGFAMLNVARSIVSQHSLSSEPCDAGLTGHPNHCVLGVSGRHYAGFGLVPSFLVVPAVVLARKVAAPFHVSEFAVSKVAVSEFTVLVAAFTCVLLAMWIRKLGYSRKSALIGAFILAFASPFWQFGVKGFFSEPYVTLGLLLSAYLLSEPRGNWSAALSGLAFGAACGCRINAVSIYPAMLLYIFLLVRERSAGISGFLRAAGFFTAAFSVCIGLIGFANYTRFGSPFKTGYHVAFPSASVLFGTPILQGILGVLFDGEVGLLIFAPWVVMALFCFPAFARRHQPEATLCAVMFIINLVFFAKYAAWHAGWVAGPRFLTPMLPFAILALLPLFGSRSDSTQGSLVYSPVWRGALAVLLLFGVAVQALGTLYPPDRYYALTEFYSGAREKPWWAGSIPLASLDFLGHVEFASKRPMRLVDSADRDGLTVAREQAQAFAAMGTKATEDDFLDSFPNGENLKLPNLVLFKMKLMGLPSTTIYAYAGLMLLLGIAGVTGLRRYTIAAPPC